MEATRADCSTGGVVASALRLILVYMYFFLLSVTCILIMCMRMHV